MKQIVYKLYQNIKFKKYYNIFKKFKSLTMIPQEVYYANLELCNKYSTVSGYIVECGTWKGGMIGGIALMLGQDRKYMLFDSFEGLPPARSIDGDTAIKWQTNKNSISYYDNCKAHEKFAHEAMKIAGAKRVSIVKGWFRDTLPKVQFKDEIAILRMDADWYDSTLEILNNLFPYVKKGGIIIIDDYYTWDGCSRAVHDYLSINKRTERIFSYRMGVCYIVKK